MAQLEHGRLADDMRSVVSAHPDPAAVARLSALPPYNAQLRTTCVATRLEGGHADNALPQVARALVNCRILPGHAVADVQRALEQAIGDPKVAITLDGGDVASAPSPLNRELVAAIEKLTPRFWPGIPVVPTMSAGATDGRFLRNAGIPCYATAASPPTSSTSARTARTSACSSGLGLGPRTSGQSRELSGGPKSEARGPVS